MSVACCSQIASISTTLLDGFPACIFHKAGVSRFEGLCLWKATFSLGFLNCRWEIFRVSGILFSNIYCSHVSGKNLWPLVIRSIAYVQGPIPSIGYEKQAEASAARWLEENHQFCAQQGKPSVFCTAGRCLCTAVAKLLAQRYVAESPSFADWIFRVELTPLGRTAEKRSLGNCESSIIASFWK